MTQPRGRSSGRPFAILERRGLLLPNGIINLQTRCSHRASPHAQSRALSGGPSFYAHGAASAFCSRQGPPFQPGQGWPGCTLLILDCRLLPPNNRLPSAPVPQPICQACPTAFFICGPWNPATDVEKEGEVKREETESFGGPPWMGSKWLNHHSSMFDVHTVHCTRTHTCTRILYMAQGSVQCAVRREAYTVSQSTSPSDPFRGLPGGVFATATRSSVNNRRAGRRGSLSDLRSESEPAPAPDPHCMSRSKYLCPAVPTGRIPCQILHLTYYHGWGSATAQQPTNICTPPRMVKDSIRACGPGQGAVSIFACSWWGVI
jgi:hypothetical protein